MVTGLWGKKIGMTQVFTGDKAVPVTVIDIAHWVITQIKTQDRDGYDAVQFGRVKAKYADQEFSDVWLKKPKTYFNSVREVRLSAPVEGLEVGKVVDTQTVFAEGDAVDVFGVTKGCGFAGVVRRHNFAGPPASHGHTMGKRTGSIGFMATQGKVIKGKKMPGHMGAVRRVIENLDVVKIDTDAQVVLVKGSVPGKAGSFVFMRKV